MKRLYITAAILVLISTSLFAQWISVAGTYGTSINCFLTKEKSIFAGTQAGVYVSTDNGVTWTGVNTGLYSPQVFAFTTFGNTIAAGTMSGVFLTTDNGATWSRPANTGLTGSVYALTTDGTNLFAGTYSGGVFTSSDKAATWTALNNGLTKKDIQTILLNRNTLLVGTASGGVFLSTDKGGSWNAANTGLPSTDVKSLARIDSTLFAGTNSSGVYVSTNNGANWSRPGGAVKSWSMCVSGTNLYVGVYSGGVVLTKDKGTTWLPASTGLTGYNLFVQCIAEIGPNMVVGINGGTMFVRSKVEMTTTVKPHSAEQPASFALFQNYPNPFNPSTEIIYRTGSKGNVQVTVYDITGKEVALLVNEEKEAGTYSITFNASGLSSGIYYYSIHAGPYSAVRKLVLLR